MATSTSRQAHGQRGSVYVTGMWKFGSNGLTPQAYGVSHTTASKPPRSEYFRADWLLPIWTGSGVTVKMATIDGRRKSTNSNIYRRDWMHRKRRQRV